MGEIDTPIVGGALYEDVDEQKVRVLGVWVDEDLSTQVRLEWLDGSRWTDFSETVELETLVERISPDHLTRINDDYDAWKYRKNIDE